MTNIEAECKSLLERLETAPHDVRRSRVTMFHVCSAVGLCACHSAMSPLTGCRVLTAGGDAGLAH
jgi:hypothetical protein